MNPSLSPSPPPSSCSPPLNIKFNSHEFDFFVWHKINIIFTTTKITITNDNTIGGMSAASFGHSHFYNLNSPNAVSQLAWRCLKGGRRKKLNLFLQKQNLVSNQYFCVTKCFMNKSHKNWVVFKSIKEVQTSQSRDDDQNQHSKI